MSEVTKTEEGNEMFFCKKVGCPHFEIYEDWAPTPDGEVRTNSMWCAKLGRDLNLRDCEHLYFHGCVARLDFPRKEAADVKSA